MMQPGKDRAGRIAEVVVPGVHKIFHYTIPEEFMGAARAGVRVKVPLGRRYVTGYLVALRKQSDYPELRPLCDLLDPWPQLTPDMVKLTRWMSEYYFAPWGSVIRSVLPAGMDAVQTLRVSLTDVGRGTSGVSPLFQSVRGALEGDELSLRQLERRIGKKNMKVQIDRYRRKGLVAVRQEVRGPVRKQSETVYSLGVDREWMDEHMGEMLKRAPAQARVLLGLAGDSGPCKVSEIRQRTGAGQGVIRSMVEKSLLVREIRERPRDPLAGERFEGEAPPVLTAEQDVAVKAICATLDQGLFETFLLYGVTGSGKTEVYIRTIEVALAKGLEAIVIVPEIALTPQLVRIFQSRFGQKIAVIHSGLSDGERYDEWNRIREGKASVAIGARSAIFAPFARLGLIVVDEEHDATYKQQEVPRYHARDVAVVRGKNTGAVVILGGATPSVESFYHARTGKYRLLTLRQRIGERPLPEVRLIDMKQEKGIEPISPTLTRAVKEGLERQEQVLLFLNRRGFAPFVICSTCGHVLECPNCCVSLTYHLREKEISCHHCGYTSLLTRICPDCKGESLELKGCGTERIETEVEKAFQGSELLRLDRDTTRRKGSAKKILDRFRSREGNILIGTQMVAKGHHLPGISTVGVLNADTSLHLPDFRAGERTFQLLTQVAGRAGRGRSKGTVYLQSYTPEHYSIQAAKDHDYEIFFEQEMHFRKSLNYPPFSRVVNLIVSANSLQQAEKAASRLGQALRELPDRSQGIEILGPARAPLATLRGKKRYHILIKGKRVSTLHRTVQAGLASYLSSDVFSGVDVAVDVDPVNFL